AGIDIGCVGPAARPFQHRGAVEPVAHRRRPDGQRRFQDPHGPSLGLRAMDDRDPGDELPAELDVTGYVGPYTFPNNDRRRIPATIYLVVAVGCFLLWLFPGRHGGVLVNGGFLA